MQTPERELTLAEPRTGSIFVTDIEEVAYTVAPWQLRMNQLSSGSLRASFSFARLHNILLTREHWTKRISGSGLSPPDFMVLSAPCAGPRLSWCGSTITADRLVYAFDGQEIDFFTQDEDDHWVMLLPTKLIANYVGEELFALLRSDTRLLSCDPPLIRQLTAQVLHTIAALSANVASTRDPLLLDTLEEQLLAVVASVLLNGHEVLVNQQKATKRFLAYRRARNIMEANESSSSIEQLVKALKVSRRSLETGFREGIAMSPQSFSRHVRLNDVHRELRRASPGELKVTTALERQGFTELGRAAGYYRKLFGESPSATLRREPPEAGMRLLDALCG